MIKNNGAFTLIVSFYTKILFEYKMDSRKFSLTISK